MIQDECELLTEFYFRIHKFIYYSTQAYEHWRARTCACAYVASCARSWARSVLLTRLLTRQMTWNILQAHQDPFCLLKGIWSYAHVRQFFFLREWEHVLVWSEESFPSCWDKFLCTIWFRVQVVERFLKIGLRDNLINSKKIWIWFGLLKELGLLYTGR
jgi:hypothetical protein